MASKARRRILRQLSRKEGLARGIFTTVGGKLRRARRLPNADGIFRSRAPAPPGVGRLPSGRLPPNYQWAGKIYRGNMWTAELARRYPRGVRFTREGFPDFSPYTLRRNGQPVMVRLDQFRGYQDDFARANARYKLPDGWTWHHHHDGRTLMAVPTDLHDAIRHAGGMALRDRGR